MNEHVSGLILDELASQLPVSDPERRHVEGCAHCSARLSEITRDRQATAQSFGYARVRARVTAERPSRWRELLPFIIPVAAALIFFLTLSLDISPRGDPNRLKGGPSVEFIASSGHGVTQARPGQRLKLKVGAAGKRFALLVAVDQDRKLELLFEGELGPSPIVTLPNEVEVTEGSVVVHAFVSDTRLDPKRVVPALDQAVLQYGGWPLEAPPPKFEGVTVVSQRLHVSP